MQTGMEQAIGRAVALVEGMYREVRRPLPPEWVEHDLTLPQVRILLMLEGGRLRVGQIASRLGVSLPTASGLVERLVSKGLVERCTCPRDRRAVECSLTPRGREVVERSTALRRSRIEEVLRRLCPEDLEGVVRALEALSRAMGTSHGETEQEE